MGMHKTSHSIWASGWSEAPVHRVDAYKATEVMRADDREETVFSGQWYKSNGKHSGLSGGNANHGATVAPFRFQTPVVCTINCAKTA